LFGSIGPGRDYPRFSQCGNTDHYYRRHAFAGSSTLVQWPLSRHGNECWWRLQPLERYRCNTLARRQYLRQLGYILLPEKPGQWRILVYLLSAYFEGTFELRDRIFSRAGRVSQAG